jgi:hypothetical protein
MRTMSLSEAITIAEKIDYGHEDWTTHDSRFRPLRQYPFLREVYLRMLRSYEDGEMSDVERDNFAITCSLMCPEFADIMQTIELPCLTPAAMTLYEAPVPRCRSGHS